MKLKNNIDAREIAFLNGIVIVKDKTIKRLEPDKYIDSLQKELLNIHNSIIPPKELKYVGKEDIDKIYEFLKEYARKSRTLLVNPDYPNIIKVDFPNTFLDLNYYLLLTNNKADENIKIKTLEEYKTWIKEKLPEERKALEYLILYEDASDEISKFLYNIYIAYSNCSKLSISRKNRKNILENLEKLGVNAEDIKDKQELILWKKLGKVLHSGEYLDSFPKTVKFFNDIREKRVKIPHPDHPKKLHKSLWKAWKNKKEDVELENYLCQEPRILDILETLRYYYIRPGISKYKKITSTTLGTKTPDKVEREMVDIVKMMLRKKVLDSIVTTNKYRKIPEDWKNIAAWEILYPHKQIEIPDDFYITCDGNTKFILRNMIRDFPMLLKFPEVLENNIIKINKKSFLTKTEKVFLFIVVKKIGEPDDKTKKLQNVKVTDLNHNVIWETEINSLRSSILAFVYYPQECKLEWIGENTNQIYSGSPSEITDKEVLNKYIERPDPQKESHFLSLYELARKLFIPGGDIELTTEDLLDEIKNQEKN